VRSTRDNPVVGTKSGKHATVKDGDLKTPMPLNTFLMQLGLELELPARPAEAPAVAEEATAGGEIRSRLWIPLVAVAVISVFGLARLAPPPPVTLPPEILGTWTTSARGYAGSRLILGSNTVQLMRDTGAISPSLRVRRAVVRRTQDSLAVVLLHDADGGTAELTLAWASGLRESLTLKNPVGVTWHRLADSVRP
jgi:hypothetical protein